MGTARVEALGMRGEALAPGDRRQQSLGSWLKRISALLLNFLISPVYRSSRLWTAYFS